MTMQADQDIQTRAITLTVHLRIDERYEESCIADEVMVALESLSRDDVLVDAVAAVDHIVWAWHLTEREACPHCTATLDHPLSDGWGCTNDWHHKGDRHRRAQRRQEIGGQA